MHTLLRAVLPREPFLILAYTLFSSLPFRTLQPHHPAGARVQPESIPEITGEDVQGRPLRLTVATGERVLLVLTDRESRAVSGSWLRTLNPAIGQSKARRVTVVALPPFVPTPFRASIRSAFQSSDSVMYLLDWGGEAVRRAVRGRALPCLFVIGPERLVSASACGAVDPARAQALAAALAGSSIEEP